jgi:type IV secretion system protein VirB5
MQFSRTLIAAAIAAASAFSVAPASAQGIPVIDVANLANSIQQVTAWAQQYQQMVQQIQHQVRQYESLSGVRNMAGLVNNPLARQYLPKEYAQILSQGVGQWEQIYNQARITDSNLRRLAANSTSSQAWGASIKQAAINRAAAEEGYRTASNRFADIQVLLDRVNAAPDAKDIADLQARIQAEQVMMQNEANKLAMLQQLAQAQRDLEAKQAGERTLAAIRKPLPKNW